MFFESSYSSDCYMQLPFVLLTKRSYSIVPYSIAKSLTAILGDPSFLPKIIQLQECVYYKQGLNVFVLIPESKDDKILVHALLGGKSLGSIEEVVDVLKSGYDDGFHKEIANIYLSQNKLSHRELKKRSLECVLNSVVLLLYKYEAFDIVKRVYEAK